MSQPHTDQIALTERAEFLLDDFIRYAVLPESADRGTRIAYETGQYTMLLYPKWQEFSWEFSGQAAPRRRYAEIFETLWVKRPSPISKRRSTAMHRKLMAARQRMSEEILASQPDAALRRFHRPVEALARQINAQRGRVAALLVVKGMTTQGAWHWANEYLQHAGCADPECWLMCESRCKARQVYEPTGGEKHFRAYALVTQAVNHAGIDDVNSLLEVAIPLRKPSAWTTEQRDTFMGYVRAHLGQPGLYLTEAGVDMDVISIAGDLSAYVEPDLVGLVDPRIDEHAQ